MVLSGDGGDEVLSGYNAYQTERLITAIPQAARPAFSALGAGARFVSRHVPAGRPRFENLGRLATTAAVPFIDRLAAKASWADEATLRGLFPGLLDRVVTPREFIADSLRDVATLDGFYQLMHFNLRISLPDDMLTKVDRMSMAHSLEVRAPFLDHRLVELMMTVHKGVKMRGFERKSVLKRTVGRSLPVGVLKARKKGFSLPVDDWFRGSRLDSALLDAASRTSLPVSRGAIGKLVDEHRNRTVSRGGLLWTLLVLMTWFETYN
jgi:asparagine synthase (glutamine-hydrolysing)